jgi:ring-1,2-phenylacetyl-CoA epoxidase subunit PaaC
MTNATGRTPTDERPTDGGPIDGRPMDPASRIALAELLLTLADDEFVLGFWDSEWTGIAPQLEEDVAMSSLATDELGHARAFYELLGELTGRDSDAIAYDRAPEAFRHARILDHPRTDWAFSVARRWLYDTADAVRLEALVESSFVPLAGLVAKIRREERYHLMHADAWLRRLAEAGGEPRDRLIAALTILSRDATSVFAPLDGEAVLVADGILVAPMTELKARWLERVGATLSELRLPLPDADADLRRARLDHSDAFRWLWGEFTSVRRLDPLATW